MSVEKKVINNVVTMGIFLLIGILSPSVARTEIVDRVAAVVNNDIILQSEVDRLMAPIQTTLRQNGYFDNQIVSILSEQRPRVIEQMIFEKLTDQQAERNKIQIGDAEVNNHIRRMMEINGLNDQSLRQMLEVDGISYEEYRKKIRDQLLRTKLVNYEVKSKIVITDLDIKAAYDKNNERYSGVTQYHLRHILIKVPADAGKKQREFLLQRLQLVHSRLRAGESFAQLAIENSEAGTASRGGDLGFIESRLLAEPIRLGLKGLKNGQVTEVIDTEQGYQIFRLEESKTTGGKTLEEARGEIQDKLYAEIVDQKFKNWLKDLHQKAHIQIIE
jgi:peptidyl-prolyl cis-trans isomerase SurA